MKYSGADVLAITQLCKSKVTIMFLMDKIAKQYMILSLHLVANGKTTHRWSDWNGHGWMSPLMYVLFNQIISVLISHHNALQTLVVGAEVWPWYEALFCVRNFGWEMVEQFKNVSENLMKIIHFLATMQKRIRQEYRIRCILNTWESALNTLNTLNLCVL